MNRDRNPRRLNRRDDPLQPKVPDIDVNSDPAPPPEVPPGGKKPSNIPWGAVGALALLAFIIILPV